MKAFGLLAMLGAVFAAIVLALGMKSAQSAPQEAAIAALAAAIAIIPYVFYRALQTMNQADELAAIRQLLEKVVAESKNAVASEVVDKPWTAAETAPRPSTPGHVVRSEKMGQEGWWWREMSNGGIRISDPYGADYDYPSISAAKAAFTWWQGPASA